MATILTIDDRPINRQFLVSLLGYSGHRLLEASDGIEGLKLVRAERPDLIILDLYMPRMDGYDFATQLHSEPEIAHTQIILYTASYYEREARELASTCGITEIITKPAEPEVILERVNAVLGLAAPAAPDPPRHAQTAPNAETIPAEIAALHTISTRLTALVELGMEMASERDLHRQLQRFCLAARHIFNARYAALGVLDEAGEKLHDFVVSGDELTQGRTLPPPRPFQGSLGQLLRERRPLRLRQAPDGPQLTELSPDGLPVRVFLGVPLFTPRRDCGWLYLLDIQGAEEFTVEDERLAVTLAAQIAITYENSMLNAAVQRNAEELERMRRQLEPKDEPPALDEPGDGAQGK